MSLNVKLQMYRGTRLKLLGGPGGANPAPIVTPSTAGMLIYTTDSQEVFVDTGSAFQRLAHDQKVLTAANVAALAALSQIGGGTGLLGDLAIVNGVSTYILTAYPSFLWTASTAVALGTTIIDSNGNLQTVTTAGTTKSGVAPVWAGSGTTSDGTATWTKGSGWVQIGLSSGVGITGLGGATTSQWVAYVDAAGVQHLSQPAFSDISGTLTQAQLPATIGAGSNLNSIDCGTF